MKFYFSLFCELLGVLIFFNVSFTQQTFWQSMNGPFSGEIEALVIDKHGNIFAGTNGGGVFKSTTHGDVWVLTGLRDVKVEEMIARPAGDLFVATQNRGIFRSVDQGDMWFPVNSGLTNLHVSALTFGQDGVLFAGTNGSGVFKSTDDGNSWSPINHGLTDLHIQALFVDSKNNLFAGTPTGIFKSSDNGENWIQVFSGGQPFRQFAANSKGYIFVAGSGVRVSIDDGMTWQEINKGLEVTNIFSLWVNDRDDIFVGTYLK
ncbi:MAG: hypothetical protein D6813_15525, partial [Calditrichaeota bacterium]